MVPAPETPLQPGFLAFHGNRAEALAEVIIHWIQRHPLEPLEQEIVLVQSNGMGEWFKMEMARLGGVCAATRVELPSRFLWRTFRQVLGSDAVPTDSALDKVPMTWRLMQLLPQLIAKADFAPVANFLQSGDPQRMLQLASRLADLFDQYQNYRSDWLEAWAGGKDQLALADGTVAELPAQQRWQAQLWRAVLQTLDAQQQAAIRPRLQRRVLQHLASGAAPATRVARRVVVFGMSQMPRTTLEALSALAGHSQIMLAIPNPCRFYWGDILDGRELLQASQRRQPLREGRDLRVVPLQEMHDHAHPLLAAWGRQGRDFIRQLDEFDDVQASRRQFALARLDMFDDCPEDAGTALLVQVQNRIRDLTPLAEHGHVPIGASDRSIVFHSAHSSVRELEILHDQLLSLLADKTQSPALSPRDVIVMVPDIGKMESAIRAIFGQFKNQDPRYIPFDIADTGSRTTSPLIGAVEWLLGLPAQRCYLSDLVGLLEVSAIATRFGIDNESLPRLAGWMRGAQIRWGLHQKHRAGLGLDACAQQNTAWFGLRRMLLGYASGAVPSEDPLDLLVDIEPYAEIGGLDAQLAGALAHFLQGLANWYSVASTPATPQHWVLRCRELLEEMVSAESQPDRAALMALQDGLGAWALACEQAGFVSEIPLSVLRVAWLEAVDAPRLNQRFRAGGVTFCTLMPMRAIPFQVVCLLGMNDGDYPRDSVRSDFDLMGLPANGRPGDRSRREDDRQLMLEALLSARQVLYLSWSGRSVRDNSEQPPSVLVSQLRDYLSAGWGAEVVAERTTQHPLQPFSRRYFEADSGLFTYAGEWRAAHPLLRASPSSATDGAPEHTQTEVNPADPELPVSLAQLTQFLRNPVKAFFRHRLQVVFEPAQESDSDEECFALDGLQQYGVIEAVLESAEAAGNVPDRTAIASALARVRIAGSLPMRAVGDLQQAALQEVLTTMLGSWHAELSRCPYPAARLSVRVQEGTLVLEDWIGNLRRQQASDQADSDAAPPAPPVWLHLQANKLFAKPDVPKIREEKLLGLWIHCLAIAAAGSPLRGLVVAPDGVLEISGMAQNAARDTMRMLLRLWQEGMRQALPLPPATALAHLAGRNAAQQYEGGFMQRGEVGEPCLARMFPDFETLTADGRFERLAQEVYTPLRDWAQKHVGARLHNAVAVPQLATP